jgi:hypothetical protein
MLEGSLTFVLAMFYLVNHPDPDMKRYSWQTISSTISIFIAVLIFQGCDGLIKEFIIDKQTIMDEKTFEIATNFVHQILWFWCLQFVLGHCTG